MEKNRFMNIVPKIIDDFSCFSSVEEYNNAFNRKKKEKNLTDGRSLVRSRSFTSYLHVLKFIFSDAQKTTMCCYF